MDSENKFWFGVFSLGAGMMITLILSVVFYNVYQDRLVTKMVLHGTNPVAAYCAVNDPYRDQILCYEVSKQYKHHSKGHHKGGK